MSLTRCLIQYKVANIIYRIDHPGSERHKDPDAVLFAARTDTGLNFRKAVPPSDATSDVRHVIRMANMRRQLSLKRKAKICF